MEQENTLDHLLQIEAQAAALVNDAQAEADRRVHKSEEDNRASYEEHYRGEVQMRETSMKKEIEKILTQYEDELNQYRSEISQFNVNTDKFSALLNSYLEIRG